MTAQPVQDRLTLLEVVEQLNVTYRQVDHWIRSGYVARHLMDTGSGHWRNVTPEDAFLLRLMSELVTFGLPPAKAGELARHFAANPTADFTEGAISIAITWAAIA